jgi:hypothetical protein
MGCRCLCAQWCISGLQSVQCGWLCSYARAARVRKRKFRSRRRAPRGAPRAGHHLARQRQALAVWAARRDMAFRARTESARHKDTGSEHASARPRAERGPGYGARCNTVGWPYGR